MENTITILVADRNRHVRQLLKRELTEVGYRVFLAKTAQEIIGHLSGPQKPNLLLMDPDLPDNENFMVLRQLSRQFPSIPIVLHMHCPDAMGWEDIKVVDSVEKTGSSIERVKTIVSEIVLRLKANHHLLLD